MSDRLGAAVACVELPGRSGYEDSSRLSAQIAKVLEGLAGEWATESHWLLFGQARPVDWLGLNFMLIPLDYF